MDKELKEKIKKECENLPKENLKKLCEILFNTIYDKEFIPSTREYEQTFRYINSLWCICDNIFVNKYDEEY